MGHAVSGSCLGASACTSSDSRDPLDEAGCTRTAGKDVRRVRCGDPLLDASPDGSKEIDRECRDDREDAMDWRRACCLPSAAVAKPPCRDALSLVAPELRRRPRSAKIAALGGDRVGPASSTSTKD